jgi:hypothetical protein
MGLLFFMNAMRYSVVSKVNTKIVQNRLDMVTNLVNSINTELSRISSD